MAWGGFSDNKSSEYMRLLAKVERTIQNLEELARFVPADRQEIIKQAVDVLTELPARLLEANKERLDFPR